MIEPEFDIAELSERIRRNPERIPTHIAVIMDGNGRWAQRRQKPRTYGHKMGVRAVREVVQAAGEIGVKYLTLFAFSTENWRRPQVEVSALMSLLSRTTREELDELIKNDVKLKTVGRISALPMIRQRVLQEAVERTRHNSGLTLVLALNYGGRTEIIDAIRAIVNSVRAGLLDTQDISEELVSDFLYTAGIPDPDLLIRTSGERRMSNFLIWQTSYTELYIIDTLWPDFGKRDLFEAVLDYQKRERRFGRVSASDNA